MHRRHFLTVLTAAALAGCGEDGFGSPGADTTTDGGDGDSPATTPTDRDGTTIGDGDTPTDAPTEGITDSPADTPTDTPTESPTETPADTPTETSTDTPTESPTETSTDTPTESPTETPTDTSTPTATAAADEPDEITFSGSGQTVEDDVDIIGGLTIVEATHEGESNFQVEFVPPGGEFNELVVNVIGEFDGAAAALLDEDTYQIDVTADGDWELTVRQPRPTSGDALPQSLEGDGPDVRGPFEFEGSHTATGSHDGENNFQVEVYPPEGQFQELVFNEVGEVDGAETTFSHDGIGFVDINVDGSWSLELG